MPGALRLGAGLALRLLSSRAPYGRAGVRFEPSPDRVYGVVEIGVDDLLDGAIGELLADPYVDVSIGPPGGAFLPVANAAMFEEIAADMADALAELVTVPVVERIEIERSRDGGPQGDEEAHAPAAFDAGAEPAEAVDTPPPETLAPVTDAAPAAGFDPALPEGALKPVINIDELLPPDQRAKMLADATAANKAATKPAKPKK
jgi:hypothetical protein